MRGDGGRGGAPRGLRGGDEEAAWEQAPSLGHGRAAHAVVSDGTDIWAIGGTDSSGQPVLEVERLEGDGWDDVATLPGEGLNAPAAVFLDGRIYVIGGFGTTTNDAAAAVHVYDVEAGSWTEAAPLPEPRGGHAAAVVEARSMSSAAATRSRRSTSTPSTTRPRTAGVRRRRCRGRRAVPPLSCTRASSG